MTQKVALLLDLHSNSLFHSNNLVIKMTFKVQIIRTIMRICGEAENNDGDVKNFPGQKILP